MSSDRPTPGSQTSLREANRARIVDAVKRSGGLTQVELAEATGLSAATVSNIVKELTNTGIVTTRPTSRSGRRAQQVTLARSLGLAAGIQFGERHLRVALGDFAGSIVADQRMPLPPEHRADTSLDRAALLIGDLLDSIGTDFDELIGAGIAVPAPIDVREGRLSVPGVMRGWDGVAIAEVMGSRINRPVVVDNDANLAAIAEHRYGAGRDTSSSAYIHVSFGVGTGIIVGGQLIRGFAGLAGEIGHIQVNENGLICRCGNRGCLNTVVGASSLTDLLRDSHGNLTLTDVVEQAITGDIGCRRVIGDAGKHIGTVVASLCMVLNPQRLIIGGELAETGEILLAPMRDAIERCVPPNTVGPIEVVQSHLGDSAKVIGAVTLALDAAEVSRDLGVPAHG